jgi:Domain of unknown function (DUF4760)
MFKQIIELKFSINWLRWIIYAAFLMIIAYIFLPGWREVLVFLAAVLGGIGVLISAMNEIDARHEEIGTRREQIEHERARGALQFVSDWNAPEFYHAKNKGREVLEYFEKNGHADCDFIKERQQNLMDVLNFFEEMSIAIQLGHVDDIVAKRVFRSIAIRYWQMTEPWIKNRRAAKGNPRLVCEFETLIKNWS